MVAVPASRPTMTRMVVDFPAPLRFLVPLTWAFSFWHQRSGWLSKTRSLICLSAGMF
jgi:hypothetical protein